MKASVACTAPDRLVTTDGPERSPVSSVAAIDRTPLPPNTPGHGEWNTK